MLNFALKLLICLNISYFFSMIIFVLLINFIWYSCLINVEILIKNLQGQL